MLLSFCFYRLISFLIAEIILWCMWYEQSRNKWTGTDKI